MAFTLAELAEKTGSRVHGDKNIAISSVADLNDATAGDISFLSNPQYRKYLSATSASAVILAEEFLELCPVNALVIKNPYLAYARISALLNPPKSIQPGIDSTASIAANSKIADSASIAAHVYVGSNVIIGEGVVIGPNTCIDDNSVIGDNTHLYTNVSIYADTEIGQNCIIHSGVVIGSDGFGIANDNGVWVKVPQLGKVIIGDDVEIGANTTIDRGALKNTVIHDGVKLDNQIQIAHNVEIGEHTAIAGCAGIAGSVKIGARCAIAGGVGISGHLELTDDVTITGMSLVTRTISRPGVYSSGTPLQDNRTWHRNFVRFGKLDELAKRVRELEKKLEDLEKG